MSLAEINAYPKKLLGFLAYFSLVVFVYDQYLVDLYYYKGAGNIGELAPVACRVVFVSLISAFCVRDRLYTPGDFVLLLLTIVVLPSAVILSGFSVLHATEEAGLPWAILLSVVVLAGINSIRCRSVSAQYDLNKIALYILVILNVLAVFLVIVKTLSHFSISYDGYHVRRELAKLAFPSGQLSSYFVSMFIQGVYPVLLVLALLARKKYLLCLAILNVVVLWAGFGERFPVVMSAFIFLMMWSHRRMRKGVSSLHVCILMTFVLLLGCLESSFFGMNFINDHLLRRVYAVPALLNDAAQAYYSLHSVNFYCDSLLGVIHCNEKSTSLPYMLASNILGDEKMNANVNFFAIAYLRLSYVGVLWETLIIGSILLLLNRSYEKRKNLASLAIAVLLVVKVVEQSLLTALVSSGVLVGIVYVLFAYKRPKTKLIERSI